MGDIDKYRRYAEEVRIFNGLHPHEVSDIVQGGTRMSYLKGQTIFHEGMMGSNLFVVLGGKVALYAKNRLIARCEVGEAFGEMAVLNQRPRTATAAAETDVDLFTLDESQINEILEKRVAVRFLMNIIHVLSEHLEKSNTLIADVRKR